ncbi:unnamed protein product [Lepeophtheirus salmonis]|uniref:(salmon louse) hypothetical protein n=1 Tax=Lepeophtheirus salmonis TaxID=72036 RepID=A0A7R8CGT6_LEPSM|nr:unnamed protein product [Lepeophtheirus salmonis]CAF2779008.1 unnamed protein product [Lepeophtheirus salmonis]
MKTFGLKCMTNNDRRGKRPYPVRPLFPNKEYGRPLSPRSYIHSSQIDEEHHKLNDTRNFNSKESDHDALSFRTKRRRSFDEDVEIPTSWEVKLPAPCKLSKSDNNENEELKEPILESPASPVEANTLLSPESPPPPTIPDKGVRRSKTPSSSPSNKKCAHNSSKSCDTSMSFVFQLCSFSCLKCEYSPAVPDDAEDLLMHYGCDEKLSFQFYDQDLKDLSIESEERSSGTSNDDLKICHYNDGARISITCEICNSCFDKERLFIRHISLRHFTKVLCDELPKRSPFICPFLDSTGGSKGSIRIVVDEPPKSPTKSIEPPSIVSPDSKVLDKETSKKSSKKCSSSLVCKKCPKKTFASQMSLNYHLMVTHFFPDLPKIGPYSCPKCDDKYPERVDFTKHFLEVHLTDHKQSDVRRKITQKWETTSVDIQNQRIEELEKLILDLKNEHEDTLKKKSSDFEKWILQKEKQIEDEIDKRKSVEDSCERSNLDVIELQKQLEQVRKSHKSSEDMLVEKHNLNHSLMKEKKSLEKEVDRFKNELKESHDLYANLEMSLKELKIQFDNRGDQIEDLNNCLVDKDDEIKDASTKMLLNKENSKKFKEVEHELKEQISKLSKSNKKLEYDLSAMKDEVDQSTRSEVKRLEKDQGLIEKQLEEYQSKLKDSSELIDGLEVEKNSLLDSLEKVQKVLRDYEISKDSLAKLQNENKELHKKNKEVTRSVKQLQTSLNNLEKNTYKNSSSLSHLTKEKTQLEKNDSAKLKKSEASIDTLKTQVNSGESQKAKVEAIVQSRKDEILCLQVKLEETNKKLRTYEKNNSSSVHNKELEIQHLKANLNQLKEELRNEKSSFDSQLNRIKSHNEKFEVEYSEKITELETMKSSAADTCRELSKKEETLKKIKETGTNIQKVGKLIQKGTSSTEAVSQLLGQIDSQKFVIEKDVADLDIRIKEEPLDSSMDNVPIFNASKPSIVLNMDGLKKERVESEQDKSLKKKCLWSNSYLNAPLKKFTTRKKSSLLGKRRTSNSRIEDLTGKFDETDEDVVCGLCLQYDPPLPDDVPRSEIYNTEWVGCDCGVWYHKLCTKLSKFSTRFSCKSVKKKCVKP